MPIYQDAANQLLNVVNDQHGNDFFNFLNYDGFVFEYRRNYTGLMAQVQERYINSTRDKQGYFDIRGTFNGNTFTHVDVLQALHDAGCTLDQCYAIWRGWNLQNINVVNDRQPIALLALAMLFFEQEINFGREVFQQYSHFDRTRDYFMGYVLALFDPNRNFLNEIGNYINYNGQLNLPTYQNGIKNYCDLLANDVQAIALMNNNYAQIEDFRRLANAAPINRHLYELRGY